MPPFTDRPSFFNGKPKVEFVFFDGFGFVQNVQMRKPGNLCQQCCHKFRILARLVKLFHPVQSAPGKAFDVGMLVPDKLRPTAKQEKLP